MYNKIRVTNISHLVRKQIKGMYETKHPTEEQKRKYIRTEEELTKQDKIILKLSMSIVILQKKNKNL